MFNREWKISRHIPTTGTLNPKIRGRWNQRPTFLPLAATSRTKEPPFYKGVS